MKKATPTQQQSILILIGSLAALLSAPAAKATNLYWDTNNTVAGALTGNQVVAASGTWGVNNFWTDNANGTTGNYQVATTSADTLYFWADPATTAASITSSASNTYIVTVSGTQSANGLVFQDAASTAGGNQVNAQLGVSGVVSQINLGSGGITALSPATGTLSNVNKLTIYSNLNLTDNQTWSTGNGGIYLYGNLMGSGNLLLTSTNGAVVYNFKTGDSANWTGNATVDGVNLTFDNSQQLVSRLSNSTLTLKSTTANWTRLSITSLDAGGTTNFKNNIVFVKASAGYQLSLPTNGTGRGAVLQLSGVLSGTMTALTLQGYASDFSGTGQFGQIRISGNNTDLVSDKTGVKLTSSYLYLDSNNALGVNNSLTTQVGGDGNGRSASGLYLANGITYTGSINVAQKTAGATATSEAFLGLDGTGNASVTGTVTLNAGVGSYTNNLHLRALAGGTLTVSGRIVDSVTGSIKCPVLVDGGGTVVLTGSNSTYSGNTVVNAGTLQLDFSQSTATSNIVNSTANNSALVMGGGALNVVGKDATANSQRFNGTTVSAGASTIKVSSAATSGSVGLTLGALTRNAGGTVDFVLPTTGGTGVANGISTTTTSVSNGVLASAASNGVAYATVGGTDWASLSSGNIVALSTYNANSFTSTDNADVTADASVGAGSTVNTLRFNNGTARTLTLGGGLTVSTGGILVTANAANGATITSGSLTAGGGNELVVINNGGNLAVNSVIADNGAATALTLSGTGKTTLGGANTYTGLTTVNSGTLSISGTAALGAAASAVALGDGGHKGTLSYAGGNVTYKRGFTIGQGGGELNVATAGVTVTLDTGAVTGAAYQSGSGTLGGDFIVSGAGNVTVNSNSNLTLGYGGLVMNSTGLLLINSTNTFTGGTVINSGTLKLGATGAIGGASTTVVVNGGVFDLGAFTNANYGSVTLNGGVIQNGSFRLDSGGTVYVTSGTLAANIDVSLATVNGALSKSGTGTVVFTGTNNTSAGTYVTGGTLVLATNRALNNSSGSLAISNATVAMGGYADTVGVLVMDSGTLAGTSASQLTGSSYSFTNSGLVSANLLGSGAALSKSGTGTVTLTGSNTYTGATTVNGGKLAVNGRITASAVTVNSGGILGGSGTIGGAVSVLSGGHFAPGNSISTTFQTGALTLSAGSITDIELGTANATHTAANTANNNDRTTVNGALVLGGTLNLIDWANAGGTNGSAGAGSYLIFTQTGLATGSFSNIVNINGYHAKVDQSVSGSVYVDNYQVASANTQPATVNLGITHVGGSFTNTALTIQNTGTNNGFSEGLNATKGATTGAATLAGSNVSNLAGGATSTAITVGLSDTATAGAKTGTATVGFASNGSTTSGYGNTALTDQTVTVNGQVNYYADPTLSAVSGGNLTATDATHYTLSLGSYNLNTGEYTATISLNNFLHDATYQDLLSGTFNTSAKGLFTLVGFDGTLEAIASGTNVTLTVSFNTTDVAQGDYEGTILFNPTSANASGTSSLSQVSLGLEFTVVPEPSTWAMIVGGMGMLAFGQRLRRRING